MKWSEQYTDPTRWHGPPSRVYVFLFFVYSASVLPNLKLFAFADCLPVYRTYILQVKLNFLLNLLLLSRAFESSVAVPDT